jgi:hypothetical protein
MRNPRITPSQARAIKSVLRAHGYLPKRKATKRRRKSRR